MTEGHNPYAGAVTSDEELERLKRRKILEMQKELLRKTAKREAEKDAKQAPKPSPEEILRANLVDQGLEVLEAFNSQYPEAAKVLVPLLARAITEGKVSGPIDGGSLLQFLRSVGYRVRIETRIYVGKRGELKELSEYLKEKNA